MEPSDPMHGHAAECVNHAQWASRSVTLICGPPGSGKSTLARKLHPLTLELEDIVADDYRTALRLFGRRAWRVGRNHNSDIAVVRSAPGVEERQHHEQLCRPSRTIVLLTPAHVCRERVLAREVERPGALAAVDDWWSTWRAEHPPADKTSREWT